MTQEQAIEKIKFQSTRPRGARRPRAWQPWPGACFNPRAHAGRDLRCFSVFMAPTSFNPRAHAGRDPTDTTTDTARYRFNPRAHAGRDPTSARSPTWRTFQSTRPRGARHRSISRLRDEIDGFNPRAHAGRDLLGRAARRDAQVSIHAPTRGATFACLPLRTLSAFQSTRPRGARPSRPLPASSPTSFNPRAHAGRDAEPVARPFVGEFQSTRPRGARLSITRRHWLTPSFQSTRPRGARPDGEAQDQGGQVSIHAPTRGATPFV